MTITSLTLQQVFDNALFGVRAQGYVRSAHGGDCMYRGPNGLKCGIGHSIPDDLYHHEMEGGVDTLMTRARMAAVHSDIPRYAAYAPINDLFKGLDPQPLSLIQSAHDTYLPGGTAYCEEERFRGAPLANPGELFEAKMADIAKRYDLTYTPVPQPTTEGATM